MLTVLHNSNDVVHRRYKVCAADFQTHYHLPTAPKIVAVFADRHSSPDEGTRAAVVAAGCLCVELSKPEDCAQLLGPASTCRHGKPAFYSQSIAVDEAHASQEVETVTDGDRDVDGYESTAASVPQMPSPPQKPVVVLDQGMLAVLVADIFQLSKADMAEANITKMTLLNSPLSVTEPEGLLRFIRPWKRYLEQCKLYACASAVLEFKRFLALRGNPTEHANWQTAIETGLLKVIECNPADGVVNLSGGGAVPGTASSRMQLYAAVDAVCAAHNSPVSTAPTICVAIDLGATALMDQQGPCMRLRFEPQPRGPAGGRSTLSVSTQVRVGKAAASRPHYLGVLSVLSV